MSPWEEIKDTPLAFGITAGLAGLALGPLPFLVSFRRLLPLQRLRTGNWTGAVVFFTVLLFYLAAPIAISLLDSVGFYDALFDDAPPILRLALWASPLTFLLFLANLFLILFLSSRTHPSDLGLSGTRWPQNCILGYVGFLIVTPLILGLNLCVHLVFWALDFAPNVHPLVELGQKPLTIVEWGLILFQVAVAAPIMEEVVFRGVVQGWLPRASFLSNAGRKQKAMLAVVGSSLFWALSHSSWPDPIPLFFLGLGIGFLAYRTQNLLPGIILHALFNTVAFLEMILPKFV